MDDRALNTKDGEEFVKPWIQVSAQDNKLILENLYLNGLHALHRLFIRNNTPFPLNVKLRSNLGPQMAFQLTNENLPDCLPSLSKSRGQEGSWSQEPMLKDESMANFVQWLSMDSSLDSLPTSGMMTSEPQSMERKDTSYSLSSSTHSHQSGSAGNESASQRTVEEQWAELLSNPQVTTNTVSAAIVNSSKDSSNFHGHHFNQLFNYVNHTDEIKLRPLEVSSLILAFLPDEKLKKRYKRLASEGYSVSENQDDVGLADKPSDFYEDGQSFDSFEINGLLFFFAYKDVPQEMLSFSMVQTDSDISKIGISNLENSSTEETALPLTPSVSMNRYTSGSSRTYPSDSATSSTFPSSASKEKDEPFPDFQLTVKFRSKVCKSVLWSDMGGSGLNFDDCVVGGTYFKDFTLWNRSEIDLYFILNTVDLNNGASQSQLKFSDYDSGEALDDCHIPPYSPLRIRIIFKPFEVGEFNYDLQIENANDYSNNIQAHIHAMVRSIQKEESLVVSSGSLLDFGDCCAGTMSKQKLVLKNVSDSSLDVVFSSDESSLIFQLKTDDLDGSGSGSVLNLDKSEQLLLDRLHELSSMESTTPDFSGPVSLVSSRPSSPASAVRRDPDIFSIPGSVSSIDLSVSSSDSSLLKIDQADFAKVLKRDGENDYTRIEEIQLRPGTERVIEVIYRPEKDSSNFEYLSGRLLSKSFRITLIYSVSGKQRESEKKVIQCKARTCTSVIEVSPKELHFGDTDVGTLKSLPIKVTNCSDLPAKIEVRFVSKVLTCYRGELIVPTRQSIEVKLDIYPRKVNADYRKQITVANLLNRDNDQTIQVFATNIDKYRVTYHSLFYRLLTPSSTNFIDFGSTIINSPVVRSFAVENVTSSKLLLEFCATLPGEVVIYEKAAPSHVIDTPTGSHLQDRKEKLLQSIEVKRKVLRAAPDSSQLPNTNLRVAQNDYSSNVFRPRSQTDSTASELVGSEYLDLASGPGAREILKSGKRRPGSTARTESQSSDVPRDSRPFSSTRKTLEQRLFSSKMANLSHVSPASLSLESSTSDVELTGGTPVSSEEPTYRPTEDFVEMLEQSRVAIEKILDTLENESIYMNSPFFKNSTEDRIIRVKVLLLRELRRATDEGRLHRVSTLEVNPESRKHLYVVFTPSGVDKSYIQGKPKKLDSRILINLKEYDKSLFSTGEHQEHTSEVDMPVRELLLRSSVCRSILELGQKNINFGIVDKHEKRTKKIVIRNNSEFPAFYAIKKTGSVASGDLVVTNSKNGIIRGFGKREVEFIFDPSLSGPYQEKLTVENVHDSTNNQVVNIKATVKRATHFFIEKLSIDFGVCMINETGNSVQKIAISNTLNKHIRVVDVGFIPEETVFGNIRGEICFDMLEEDGSDLVSHKNGEGKLKSKKRPMMIMTREIEEQIEHLEQKLKIARRKGRKDKLKKISDKITRLKSGFAGEDYETEPIEENADAGTSAPRDSVSANRSDSGNGQSNIGFSRTRKTKTSISFSLHPRSCRTVLVTFRPTEIDRAIILDDFAQERKPIFFTGNIYVQEHKNTDVVKKVAFQANVCFDHASYISALSSHVMELPPMDDTITHIVRESAPSSVGGFVNSPSAEEVIKMTVELSTIDLGKIEIGTTRECYFTLRNTTTEEQRFEVVELQSYDHANLLFKEQNGALPPKENRRIYLSLSPSKKGRERACFDVVSDGRKIPVTFTWFGIFSRYLQFQDMDSNPISEIDFGFCCIDTSKKFTKSFPVQVTNVSDENLVIHVSSNLSQQCSIFLEESLKNSINSLIMSPTESKVVYVAIQPYVNLPTAQTTKKASSFCASDRSHQTSSSSAPRPLVGGIRFLVHLLEEYQTAESAFLLSTETLRFQAVTGQSLIDISDKIVDFGRSVVVNKEYVREVIITNRTPQLPMHFQLKAGSDCLTVDKQEIVMEPDRDDMRVPIILTLRPKEFGLFNETIEVINLNNTQQSLSLTVRLFTDSGKLQYSSPMSPQLTKVIWENIYLTKQTNESESFSYSFSSEIHNDMKSLEFQNMTEELVEIFPRSDLPLSLRWTMSNENGFIMEKHPSRIQNSNLNKMYCGPVVMIQPWKKVIAHIFPPLPSLSADDASSTGLIHLDGFLSFESEKGIALQYLNVSASYCESIAELDCSTIDLGCVGHMNSWNPISLALKLKNASEIPLFYSVKCPAGILINSENHFEGCLDAFGSNDIAAVFYPKLIANPSSGLKKYTVEVLNLKNSNNRLELSVSAVFTLHDLKFDRLDRNGIFLPCIPYPSVNHNSFSEFSFSIHNFSDTEKKVLITPVLIPEAEEILDLSTMSKLGAASINSAVSVPPSSFLECRVRGSTKESFILNHSDKRTAWFNTLERHRLGDLIVYTKDGFPSNQGESDLHIVDSLAIYGSFTDEQMFSLSRKHIQFQSFSDWDQDRIKKQSDSIIITNLSVVQPLEFKVELEFPVDKGVGISKLKLHPLDDSMIGVIPPASALELNVDLLDSGISGLSEDIKILIFNSRSIFPKSQTVTVNIEDVPTPNIGTPVESAMNAFLVPSDRGISTEISAKLTRLDDSYRSESESQALNSLRIESDANPSESQSISQFPARIGPLTITLKGCKRTSEEGGIPGAGGLFVLDLAQQDLGSNAVTRKLIFENSTQEKLTYRLRTLGGDAPWMALSRNDGTFNGAGVASINERESQTVTLSFSTAVRGVFLAYMVIENVTFPADNKIIKIQMEVVAPQNIRRAITGTTNSTRGNDLPPNNHVFDVYVSGISAEVDTMEFDNLYYDSSFSGRCLVIHNREVGPLEFVVKDSLGDDAELLFSLSRSTAKLFRSLIIDGESSMRIYLHFRPPRSWLLPYKEPEEMSLEEADTPRKKTAEIMVTCRLVKDYSKVIQVNAYCRQPQIKLSNTTFLFTGSIQKKEMPSGESSDKSPWIAEFSSVKNEFVLVNLLRDPLEYLVMNETVYFTVEKLDEPSSSSNFSYSSAFILEAGQSHRFRIFPKMESILKHAEFLRKERYVLEYLTVYNKRRPKESYWISLKLCLGHLSQFQYASGSRSSFDSLEISICIFLNDSQAVPLSFLLGDLGQNQKLDELFFRFNYIVDQLVHNGTREHGENYLQLATLLFTVFFSGAAFTSVLETHSSGSKPKKYPPSIARWIQSFFSFMSYFPHRLGRMSALRDLASNLLGTSTDSTAITSSSTGVQGVSTGSIF